MILIKATYAARHEHEHIKVLKDHAARLMNCAYLHQIAVRMGQSVNASPCTSYTKSVV